MGDRRDITINGSGSTAGGTFRKVVIRGEGSVTSDMDCQSFIIRGQGTARGDVAAEEIRTAGHLIIHGRVKANTFSCYGNSDIHQEADIKDLIVRGGTDVGGDLKVEDANIKGRMTVRGSCEAETFLVKGGFDVKGLLNAGTVHVTLKSYVGPSQAKEIGGEKIIVKEKNGLLENFLKPNLLTADLIEGDDIYLECTNAKIVRGKNVRIGPACEIELVEYERDFQQDKNSKVKENRKI
ncbi:hypothetical protein ACFO4N_08100 [Camelliibacillus cellulosilyticus]|uniref:Cytoskeletal protein CcmA (Bactofilin family) n=2 Tax=Camelliibacillus cellulosilyticus TaxID=2174486 RepID=A0ABV9GKL0_9BACL